jgi:eukaryotic-like serine/threonine-protein kinase
MKSSGACKPFLNKEFCLTREIKFFDFLRKAVVAFASEGGQLSVTAERTHPHLRFGSVEINLTDGVLRSKRRALRLQEQPLQILIALLERPGEVVTREELRRRLWPSDTYVEFDGSLNHAVQRLRDALGDSAQSPHYIETIPRRGYRLIPSVETVCPPQPARSDSLTSHARFGSFLLWTGLVLLFAVIVTAFLQFRRSVPKFTERDSVLIADIANLTGEPIFDTTLRTAIAVKLDESPYLNTISDNRTRAALQLMHQSPDAKVAGEVAREVCQRLNSKAVINGSITRLGSHYAIMVEALDCRTGARLALQQVEAANQESVLKVLGNATSGLRSQLGESIKSVHQFSTPLEEATTSSLEALQAFSLGRDVQRKGLMHQAIELYQRAIQIDSNFALAYYGIGICYLNLGESAQARSYLERAFVQRQRSSERERLQMTALYYFQVTGELKQAITTYQLYQQKYPSDAGAHLNLAAVYGTLGLMESALTESRKSLDLSETAASYHTTALFLGASGHIDEAAILVRQAVERGLIAPSTLSELYGLSFARGDDAAMAQSERLAKGTTGEGALRFEKAKASAFLGKLSEARKLYLESKSIAASQHANQSQQSWRDQQAFMECEFGNHMQARALLSQSGSRSFNAALVLARMGDFKAAESITKRIGEQFPLGTITHEIEIPVIRATIELQRGNGPRAVELLSPAMPYRLRGFLIPYLAGYANLKSGAFSQAAENFQVILDHRGLGLTSPLYPLAQLGLARARAAEGNITKALSEYDGFLNRWKDADHDIPIYRQAEAEYTRLLKRNQSMN